MPTTINVPENQRNFGHDNIRATDADDISEDVYFSQDGILRGIPWQKPADVDLTIVLHMDVTSGDEGAVHTLLNSPGSEGRTEGTCGAGRPVLAGDGSTGSKLVITTANGSSGVKAVTPVVSPADVGV